MKSAKPLGGGIKSTASVRVSCNAVATTPVWAIQSATPRSFESVRVLMLSDANMDSVLLPGALRAARCFDSLPPGGGQLCCTTGLEASGGCGGQLSLISMFSGMGVKDTQHLFSGGRSGVPCGPHCNFAMGSWESLPLVSCPEHFCSGRDNTGAVAPVPPLCPCSGTRGGRP